MVWNLHLGRGRSSGTRSGWWLHNTVNVLSDTDFKSVVVNFMLCISTTILKNSVYAQNFYALAVEDWRKERRGALSS